MVQKIKKFQILSVLLCYVFCMQALAQVRIGTTAGTIPHSAAMLEVQSNNRGLLLPRINLTSNTMKLAGNSTPTNGMLVYNTGIGVDGPGLYIYRGSQWNLIQVQATNLEDAVGTFKLSARTSPGSNYVLCDGQAVSRTGQYAALFAVISTTYGAGNGTSTFNLPDFRGRTFGGSGDGVYPIPLTDRPLTTTSVTSIGAESVTLTSGQMPVHKHITPLGADLDVPFDHNSIAIDAAGGVKTDGYAIAYTDYAGDASPAAHYIMQPTLYGGKVFIKY